MKYLVFFLPFVVAILFTSCKKENRIEGICYCEYVAGDDKEYDLRGMTREEQKAQCDTHDMNAANFGGSCELE